MSLLNANEDVASTDRGYSGLLDSDETDAFENENSTPPRALPSQSDVSEDVIRRGGYGRQKKRAKRKLSSSPESDSNKKVVAANHEDDDDALSCPICFESLTNSGSHRLTSLR